MDYTTTALVKLNSKTSENTDDTVIGNFVTDASRAIDLITTGKIGIANYFLQEAVTDEVLANLKNPQIDSGGTLKVYPHKPFITAVTALSYRYSPADPWQVLDPSLVTIGNNQVVEYWSRLGRGRVMVKISYTGGLAANQAGLPGDLVEAVTTYAIRMYKESQSGMSDTIGINDLGEVRYVKAFPVRVQDILNRYTRILPW